MHCVHKMLHSSYSDTVKLYPDIEKSVFEGNVKKAYSIIDQYISLYKKYNTTEEESRSVSKG
jgi:predicted AlkP superfamily phosphohydrolase/phosphomutase